MQDPETFWNACTACKSRGKTSQRIRKKAKLNYQKDLEAYERSDHNGAPPKKPKGHLKTCSTCDGSGLVKSDHAPILNNNFPHVAIVGAGIGGVALAVACQHRGIPFTLFERDASFDARSQGYGLTLQQASKAMAGFGIQELIDGVISTRHIVHKPSGEKIAEWGMRKWLEESDKPSPKKTNIHIARQALRKALMDQLTDQDSIKWDHQFVERREDESGKISMDFKVNDELETFHADLLVGADGIRSQVRNMLLEEDNNPLRYLDCIVILGICPLENIENSETDLLDSTTVFQTANGHERMYMMPYSTNSIMWQFSYPMDEKEAINLSTQGSKDLKNEAIKRTLDWHAPIPQILKATQESLVTGYPVYDREVLGEHAFAKAESSTIIGDAAHPMSPFKGQGANQALLDALALARKIYTTCRSAGNWKVKGLRETVLKDFEKEMIVRSAVKVRESARAAEFLHSEIVLLQEDAPRGTVLKNESK
ncbi:2-polyprenyl-6-methoxyphenol hydroxylase [Nonlabens sp. Hel1_33_55]|uniref:FAD-dependent oxidoreductase n=1 Tax=Nonlabens sp. Hel1_33_55 TaxID=1336802 RepID=UPI000875ABC3|nr:NAD(P)/FAD-dependent oxidoreductase [Nonlabens sp. Hel1_33_55]SCY02396.1 2-polyprenyl-6-methoxyphenol hydroxylase [Nonlabens sp. Hel1_33_55]